MKQVLQDLRNGQTTACDVPAPSSSSGKLLIETRRTLISAGTEKMLVEFGQAGWIGKARAQPEKVKQVLDKIRTDGLLPTLETVFSKLGEPLPLGYCNAGVVRHIGQQVTGFSPGDRVVSNGPHAELVSVPPLLCAKIPDEVSDDQAAFTVLASIGLQGVRLAQPTLGETVVVYGLGLIGLITVQLLKANGCRVVGIDINPNRLELAAEFGAEVIHGAETPDVPSVVQHLTHGRGADAVLITASTKSDQIVSDSAKMSRKRGRIVLVGVVGLQLNRNDFYEKEISFQVSCSYGPGRYDSKYEQDGNDYPLGYVRWTEQRNFEAILQLLASRTICFDRLITHRFDLADAATAYKTVQSDPSSLGILLNYSQSVDQSQTIRVASAKSNPTSNIVAAVIGAGNYTRATLMPAIKKLPARLKYVVGRTCGVTVQHLAKNFSVELATTDFSQVLNDDEVNTLLITTNHDSHASLVCQALAANKHVFVEKPLALTVDQLSMVSAAVAEHPHHQLAVGFNRRFSPHMVRCKELLRGRSAPITVNMLINAGEIPADHWVHDVQVGGGRIIGEACHFIDLMVFLSGSLVESVMAQRVGGTSGIRDDKMAITLLMQDGSIGSICYFANGSKSFPKESLHVFTDNRVLAIDNFRRTTGYGFKKFSSLKTSRQEKGHQQQFKLFFDRVAGGGDWLIPYAELENVSFAAIAAVTAAREERVVKL
jgi:predicted dehydrogenase